jgi:hypothetical protein
MYPIAYFGCRQSFGIGVWIDRDVDGARGNAGKACAHDFVGVEDVEISKSGRWSTYALRFVTSCWLGCCGFFGVIVGFVMKYWRWRWRRACNTAMVGCMVIWLMRWL